MKKTNIFIILFLVLLTLSLFAQEISHHKLGLKYDFRVFLQDTTEHNFDVLHYRFDWRIDFDSRHIQGKAQLLTDQDSTHHYITLPLATPPRQPAYLSY